MKSVLLFVISILIFYSSKSQDLSADGNHKFDITLSIGLMPNMPEVTMYNWGHLNYDYAYVDLNNVATIKTLYTPTFSCGFLYEVSDVISVGANIFYSTEINKTIRTYDLQTLTHHRQSFMGFVPILRFSWLNKKMFSLYSAVSLGTGLSTYREKKFMRAHLNLHPLGELTFFGVKFGNRIYGFSDISLSRMSYLKFGVGYKFLNRKEQ